MAKFVWPTASGGPNWSSQFAAAAAAGTYGYDGRAGYDNPSYLTAYKMALSDIYAKLNKDPRAAGYDEQLKHATFSVLTEGVTLEDMTSAHGGARSKSYKQRGGNRFTAYINEKFWLLISSFPKTAEAVAATFSSISKGVSSVASTLDDLASKNVWVTFVVLIQIAAAFGAPPPYNFIAKYLFKIILANTPDCIGIVKSLFGPTISLENLMYIFQILARLATLGGSIALLRVFKRVGGAVFKASYDAAMTIGVRLYVAGDAAIDKASVSIDMMGKAITDAIVARLPAAEATAVRVAAASGREPAMGTVDTRNITGVAEVVITGEAAAAVNHAAIARAAGEVRAADSGELPPSGGGNSAAASMALGGSAGSLVSPGGGSASRENLFYGQADAWHRAAASRSSGSAGEAEVDMTGTSRSAAMGGGTGGAANTSGIGRAAMRVEEQGGGYRKTRKGRKHRKGSRSHHKARKSHKSRKGRKSRRQH